MLFVRQLLRGGGIAGERETVLICRMRSLGLHYVTSPLNTKLVSTKQQTGRKMLDVRSGFKTRTPDLLSAHRGKL